MTKPRPFGHYFILEKIAQGGMAEIFKGLTYDFSGLKKFIVIKRILPHIAANEEFIHMLIDEAKIAVRLNHGNIAQTFDLGKVAEDYFMVMEFVDGRTISQFFKKSVALKESIPIPVATYIVSEICNGLDYIHRRQDEKGESLGIVHCDISPQNIIVGPSGTVKIVDFGVAKAASKLSERDRGILKGKFAYMSPEQTEGIFVDARSDIFSTGVLLWEILTGRRLFKKKTNIETIEAVNSMTVYPPSAYRNEIPSELDEIVMKALNRDSKQRYESAHDLSLALTKFNLKLFPEFKPAQLGDVMTKLFEDEDNTGDLFQEKTQHEEATHLDDNQAPPYEEEEEKTPSEDTVIIDPQELDFQSIFEDIELEEVSEVTKSIGLAYTPPDPEELEPTGDIPGRPLGPPEITPPTAAGKNSPLGSPPIRRGLLAVGGIFLLLGIYWIALMLFSNSPAKLDLQVEPSDARVVLGGEPLDGASPYRLKDLKPRTDYLLKVTAEGYQPLEEKIYLFPHWKKTMNVQLQKLTRGLIEVKSEPSGAAIYLDGQMTGKKTPTLLEAKNLKFPLILGISKGGPPQWTQEIQGPPQNNLEIRADLNASWATVDLLSRPAGAQVFLGDRLLGKTPLFAQRVPAAQPLQIRFQLGGYRPFEQGITFKKGQKKRLQPVLQKVPSR